MTGRVLILRPEPGASETAERARALGLEAISAPIFTIGAIDWQAPEAEAFDAVLLTSANAPRWAGHKLLRFTHLPCYAVGEATAAAAAGAGFRDLRTGASDGTAVAALMERDGVRAAFHPCGRDHITLNARSTRIERRIVYQAQALTALPEGLDGSALVLVHSPRSAAQLARLVEEAGAPKDCIALIAISDAAAQAAGPGWKAKSVAREPRDHALLELAVKLCKTSRPGIEGDA